jgi:hypothetical protein
MLNLISGPGTEQQTQQNSVTSVSNNSTTTPLPDSSSQGGYSLPEFRIWDESCRRNFKEKARALGREIDANKKRLRSELQGRGKTEYLVQGAKLGKAGSGVEGGTSKLNCYYKCHH